MHSTLRCLLLGANDEGSPLYRLAGHSDVIEYIWRKTRGMHLFWAWTHYGSEIGIPPVRSGHVEIEMPDATSTLSTPDLHTWLACTLAGPTYDDPFKLLPDGTEIVEELLSLLEVLGESDASDLLNAFAASRTDTALAALVAAWEANHKDDLTEIIHFTSPKSHARK